MTDEEYVTGFATLKRHWPSVTLVQLPVRRAALDSAAVLGLKGRVNAGPFFGYAAETLLFAARRQAHDEVSSVLLAFRPEGWNTAPANDGKYYRCGYEDGRPVHAPADFGPLAAFAVEAPSPVPASELPE